MYKKIKNGSFMNWIWFIICLMPILLLIIYSISYFNRTDTNQLVKYEIPKKLELISNRNWEQPKEIIADDIFAINNGNYQNNGNNSYTFENGLTIFNEENTLNQIIWFRITNEINNITLNITLYDANFEESYETITLENNKSYFSFDLTNYCAIQIEWQTNVTYNIKMATYSNIATLNNTLEYNLIGNNLYEYITSLKYNDNIIELPNHEFYYGDYIDFENNIYTKNGIEYPFSSNIYFEELNGTYTIQNNPSGILTTQNIHNFGAKKYTFETITNGTIIKNVENNGTNLYYNSYFKITSEEKIITNTNYEDYLQSINNTLKTNGFISNAFLNLSQFFGVTNVYYSLACYYIEYLLVIILLHLAFDILYIVPNICHKFMEKIGGERD